MNDTQESRSPGNSGRWQCVAKRLLVIAIQSVAILAVSAFLAEVGYRVYLYRLAEEQIRNSYKPVETATFSAYGVEPWLFDRQQGFVFNQKPWLTTFIKDGQFVNCTAATKANRFGNLDRIDEGHEEAELKIIIVGSSFSMVGAEDGSLVSDLLARNLSRSQGRKVDVLNYSRDATGVLMNLHTAAAKIPEAKPDVVLMLANVTALIYKRHWRKVLPDGKGGRQLYFMLDPDAATDDERNAFPQPQVINDAITPAWCGRMQAALNGSDESTLMNDPVTKILVAQHNRRQSEALTPRINTTGFLRLNRSFVRNFLKFKDPFRGVERFKGRVPYSPLALHKYSDDLEFLEVVRQLKDSRVPLLPIHLPTYPEMQSTNPDDFAYAEHGVPPDQGKSLAANLETALGESWIHLYRYYAAELKKEPLKLVNSDKDSHPSPLGVQVMADALERVLREHPATSPLMAGAGKR